MRHEHLKAWALLRSARNLLKEWDERRLFYVAVTRLRRYSTDGHRSSLDSYLDETGAISTVVVKLPKGKLIYYLAPCIGV
jgi:superfamily I DNA/RNA helicase